MNKKTREQDLTEEWTNYAQNITRRLRAIADEIEITMSEDDISYLRRTGEIINVVNWGVGNLRLGALVRKAERLEAE